MHRFSVRRVHPGDGSIRRRGGRLSIFDPRSGTRNPAVFSSLNRRQGSTKLRWNIHTQPTTRMDFGRMGGSAGLGCHERNSIHSGGRQSADAAISRALLIVREVFASGLKVLFELWRCPQRRMKHFCSSLRVESDNTPRAPRFLSSLRPDGMDPSRFLRQAVSFVTVRGVQAWRFKPALGFDGNPIAVIIPVQVTFAFR